MLPSVIHGVVNDMRVELLMIRDSEGMRGRERKRGMECIRNVV